MTVTPLPELEIRSTNKKYLVTGIGTPGKSERYCAMESWMDNTDDETEIYIYSYGHG